MGSEKPHSDMAKEAEAPIKKLWTVASDPSPKATPFITTPKGVRCACPRCEKSWVIAGSDSKSPFLRMPREIRDQIYEELLVAKLSTESQAKIDKVHAAPHGELDRATRQAAREWYECELRMDLVLDGDYHYRYLVDVKGLLLANKQIHAEARAIFFGKNKLAIVPRLDRVYSCRCNNLGCEPTRGACYVALHKFVNIKHLTITVHNLRRLHDPMRKVENDHLYRNNQTIVRFFKLAETKLKTLSINFFSCFNNQVKENRVVIEGPISAGMRVPFFEVKDIYRTDYLVMGREAAQAYLFNGHQVMEPFKAWKAASENVKVSGDLPPAYIDELVSILADEPLATVVKKRQAEEARIKAACASKSDQ